MRAVDEMDRRASGVWTVSYTHLRSAEEAEDAFNELSAAVEDRFPGLVLEIDVYKRQA